MEESFNYSSDDSDFDSEESSSIESTNLSNFKDKDREEELEDLKDDAIAHNLLSPKFWTPPPLHLVLTSPAPTSFPLA